MKLYKNLIENKYIRMQNFLVFIFPTPSNNVEFFFL